METVAGWVGGIVALVVGVGSAVINGRSALAVKREEARRAREEAARAETAEQSKRDATWNARYRATAEQHLAWDWMILHRLQGVEHKLGIDEPIPPPPPLFPKPPHP